MGKLCNKRKLLPAGSVAKARAKNRSFKVRHNLKYSAKGREATTGFGPRLREVEQPPYEAILKLSQAAAKKCLIEAGVLVTSAKKASFACWSCGAKAALTNDSSFRCQQAGCSQRCRLTAPLLAYTPLFHSKKGGAEPDYKELVRLSFLMGSKVSNDQAVHLYRSAEQTVEAAAHRVKLVYPKLRLCLAWTEKVHADGMRYERDLVEIDSARMCGQKSGRLGSAARNTTNKGRTLVLLGRFARRWMIRGLADRVTQRGCGPESKEEVSGTVKKALGKRTILCGDGARAWGGAAAAAGKAHLSGVAHNKRIFTPVARLRKTSLNHSTQSWLKSKSSSSSGSAKPVQETARDFKFVAGDQLAESAFGAVKKTARRMNVVGAGCKTLNGPSVIAHSSAALVRAPGLHGVLKALKAFREACANGDIKLSPSMAFDAAKHSWLQGEDMAKE